MQFKGVRPLVALTLVAALGGCASAKGNADKAIAAAEATLQTVAADAQAYVPDLYAAAGAKVAAARSDFDAGNYADALTKAQEATTEVGGLGAAITARKDELMVAWTSMSDSLPGMVQAIQTRVDSLSKMRPADGRDQGGPRWRQGHPPGDDGDVDPGDGSLRRRQPGGRRLHGDHRQDEGRRGHGGPGDELGTAEHAPAAVARWGRRR
jgi:hypothetical protein